MNVTQINVTQFTMNEASHRLKTSAQGRRIILARRTGQGWTVSRVKFALLFQRPHTLPGSSAALLNALSRGASRHQPVAAAAPVPSLVLGLRGERDAT